MESTPGVYENSTLNLSSSTPEPSGPPDSNLSASIYLILFGCVFCIFVILSGNMLVIVAISKIRFLQNTANTFVAGLAAVDMTTALSVGIQAIQVVEPSAFTDIVSCQLKMISVVTCFLASSLTLLAISCSRYICIFVPYKAHLVTSSRAKMALAFCLLYPVSVVATTTFAFHNWNSDLPCALFTLYPPGLVIFYCSHIFLSLIGTGFIYMRILREAIRHTREIADLTVNTEPGQTTHHQADTYSGSMTLLKKFSIIVGIVAVSLLPQCIVSCIICFDPAHYLLDPIMRKALTVMRFCMCVNSMINPFIYAWRFRSFRAAFRMLLCRLPPSEIARINEEFGFN